MIKTRNLVSKTNHVQYCVFLWIFVSLIIKLIVISNIDSGIWLGADGESYLQGVSAILQDGLFSKESVLQYWPAGYPIVISILVKMFGIYALPILSVVQSIIFSYGVWVFTKSMSSSQFARLTPWMSFIINFSPTLSLSSLCLGYESFTSSILLISSSLLLRFLRDSKNALKTFSLMGLLNSIAAFIQPRFILVTIVWIILSFLLSKSRQLLVLPLIFSLLFALVLPGLLVARNHQASGSFTVSNNLGVTMNIGAGRDASGGYSDSHTGVDCNIESPSDSELAKCVIAWYFDNPLTSVKLAWNKSLFFWSPWYGPNANGTMARNPWLKINPLVSLAENANGRKIVFGSFGEVTSAVWTLANILLMSFGIFALWLSRDFSRKLMWVLAAPIFVTWVIAIGTIGDHRFRVPIMGFVIFFQIVGWSHLRKLWRLSQAR